jgi:hypothetical protein
MTTTNSAKFMLKKCHDFNFMKEVKKNTHLYRKFMKKTGKNLVSIEIKEKWEFLSFFINLAISASLCINAVNKHQEKKFCAFEVERQIHCLSWLKIEKKHSFSIRLLLIADIEDMRLVITLFLSVFFSCVKGLMIYFFSFHSFYWQLSRSNDRSTQLLLWWEQQYFWIYIILFKSLCMEFNIKLFFTTMFRKLKY